jgi:hypothetical protein
MSRYENGRFRAHAVLHTRGTTHQRHPPPLPIHEINDIAFRVVDAQVDQDDHDMVPDDIRSYVEEVH